MVPSGGYRELGTSELVELESARVDDGGLTGARLGFAVPS
jgi:hypothetical protein